MMIVNEGPLLARSGHSPKRRSQPSCKNEHLCVPPRVPHGALAGIDRGAGCRTARTTGLVPALEEAVSLGALQFVTAPNRRSGRAACAFKRDASRINRRTPLLG